MVHKATLVVVKSKEDLQYFSVYKAHLEKTSVFLESGLAVPLEMLCLKDFNSVRQNLYLLGFAKPELDLNLVKTLSKVGSAPKGRMSTSG